MDRRDISQYTKLPFGTQEEGKVQCAFVIPFAPKAKPYKYYEGKLRGGATKDSIIPLVLAIFRWDGKIGFPGGKVDKGERIIDAAIREVDEELDFMIIDRESLKPLATFADEKANIHSFSYELADGELLQIAQEAALAHHNVSEVGGVFLMQIADFGDNAGWEAILANNFAATARLELEELAKQYNLIELPEPEFESEEWFISQLDQARLEGRDFRTLCDRFDELYSDAYGDYIKSRQC